MKPSATTATLALAALVLGIPACQSAEAARPIPAPRNASPLATAASRDSVLFSGGCFWGVEAVFERVKGVLDVTSGFAGGEGEDPSYQEVSTGTTGYAETVKIIFDPAVVSYTQLLQVFFSVAHDPTQLNYQGPDHGTQYRSAIFYASPQQQKLTQQYISQLSIDQAFSNPIVTEVGPWKSFYPAAKVHQGYYDKHPNQPYIVINDKPKVAALEQQFPELYNGR